MLLIRYVSVIFATFGMVQALHLVPLSTVGTIYRPPRYVSCWLVTGMISFATAGYLMIISSIRVAPVSIVSPYRYSRLLFLLLLGVIVFDERADTLMLCGSFMIIAAGLYTVWREGRQKEVHMG